LLIAPLTQTHDRPPNNRSPDRPPPKRAALQIPQGSPVAKQDYHHIAIRRNEFWHGEYRSSSVHH
jgi:hypothetical protein